MIHIARSYTRARARTFPGGPTAWDGGMGSLGVQDVDAAEPQRTGTKAQPAR
jgi:hypothetical protein